MTQEITNIELLVHPDFHLIAYDVSSEHLQLRERWNQRVQTLATEPSTALFYFSAFLDSFDREYVRNRKEELGEDTVEMDELRQRQYQELLGDRFFQFETWQHPPAIQVLSRLKYRGLHFDSQQGTVKGYGEYLELCVYAWVNDIRQQLGVDLSRCQIIPHLCFSAQVEERAAIKLPSHSYKKFLHPPSFIERLEDKVSLKLRLPT